MLVTRKKKDKVVLLMEECNPIEWKTKRLTRVCRSIKTAEAVSTEENAGRGANFGTMVRELLTGKKKNEQSIDRKISGEDFEDLAEVEKIQQNNPSFRT